MTVEINDLSDFTLQNLKRVAWQAEPVRLGARATARIAKARAEFLQMIEKQPDRPVYGVTTGFGDRARVLLSPQEREAQARVPAWLAGTGFGPELPERVVRAMIFARLVNFISGYAGLSLETTQALVSMLDGRPLPKVKAYGQDSEGELHQLFNLFHHLMGPMSQLRDQNALRNGTACAPGMLGDLALRAPLRWRLAGKVLALSLDAANLGFGPHDPALKPLLNDRFEAETIDCLNEDLAGATIEGRREFQSPISWRIITRMLGQVRRAVAEVEASGAEMLQAVSDNPVFLSPEEAPPYGRCISTGGFHPTRAYHALNGLTAAWADLCAIVARQVVLIHRHSVTGLPDKLWPTGGRNCSFFLGTTAQEVASRAQAAAVPALTPLYFGHDEQTDIIFPLFRAWEKEQEAARALNLCLAMLAASASQAFALSAHPPAPALQGFLAEVRRHFPLQDASARDLGGDAERLAAAFEAATLGQGSLLA